MEVNSLKEQLLFTTIKIETQTPRGLCSGTAFIFRYEKNSNQ